MPKIVKKTANVHTPRKPTAKPNTSKAQNAAAKPTSKPTIRILKPDFEFGSKGTKRNDAWQLCKRTKDAAKYAAAGGPRKYLPRWARAGAIAY